MLTLEKVEAEIKEREKGGFTGDNCAKLACLYVICDHMVKRRGDPVPSKHQVNPVSQSEDTTDYDGMSEFMRYAVRIDSMDALKVADDLMNTLRESHPRLYESVMQKMRQM